MSVTHEVAVVGPECTGKTTLARSLAIELGGVYLPEYARDYLIDTEYEESDVYKIAHEQYARERDLIAAGPTFAVFDTDSVVMLVWCRERFGRVPQFIERNIETNPQRLYLLTATDIDWQFDPLRESEHDRDRLFNVYIEELVRLKCNFSIVRGLGMDRVLEAMKPIDAFFCL